MSLASGLHSSQDVVDRVTMDGYEIDDDE